MKKSLNKPEDGIATLDELVRRALPKRDADKIVVPIDDRETFVNIKMQDTAGSLRGTLEYPLCSALDIEADSKKEGRKPASDTMPLDISSLPPVNVNSPEEILKRAGYDHPDKMYIFKRNDGTWMCGSHTVFSNKSIIEWHEGGKNYRKGAELSRSFKFVIRTDDNRLVFNDKIPEELEPLTQYHLLSDVYFDAGREEKGRIIGYNPLTQRFKIETCNKIVWVNADAIESYNHLHINKRVSGVHRAVTGIHNAVRRTLGRNNIQDINTIDGLGTKKLSDTIVTFDMMGCKVVMATKGKNLPELPNRDNEDRAGYNKSAGLLVVADAMGGEKGGSASAQIYVNERTARPDSDIKNAVAKSTSKRLYGRDGSFCAAELKIKKAQGGKIDAEFSHFGDVKGIHFSREGKVLQQTEEDSLLNLLIKLELVKIGNDPDIINKSEAKARLLSKMMDESLYDSRRNGVTNGFSNNSDHEMQIRITKAPGFRRQVYVLASDGITDNFTPEELWFFIEGKSSEDAIKEISEIAEKRVETAKTSAFACYRTINKIQKEKIFFSKEKDEKENIEKSLKSIDYIGFMTKNIEHFRIPEWYRNLYQKLWGEEVKKESVIKLFENIEYFMKVIFSYRSMADFRKDWGVFPDGFRSEPKEDDMTIVIVHT